MKIRIQDMNIEEKIINNFLLDDYRLHLKTQGLTSGTIRFYIKYLEGFIKYGKLEDIEVFKSEIRMKVSYNKLFDKKLKNSTFDKYRKAVIKYYDYLKEYQFVDINYGRKLSKVRVEKSLPKSIDEKEISIIYNFILSKYKLDFYRYRSYFLFSTFVNTGLRKSELMNLKKEHIFKDYIKVEKGKGNKDRIVYISKKFSNEIMEYKKIQNKNNEYLFCTKEGRKITDNSIRQIIDAIKKGTGIYIYPHLLRHTYASLCVKKGINIYTLQQQMGHSDLKTTSIYLYLNSKENWEEIQKLNKI